MILPEIKDIPLIDELENKLPTDREVSQFGIEIYEQLIRDLPQKYSRVLLSLDVRTIRACFIGIQPEIGVSRDSVIDFLPYKLMECLGTSLESISEDFVLIETPREGDTEGRNYTFTLANTRAIQKVMGNYPDYFPEGTIADPTGWVRGYIDDYLFGTENRRLTDIRVGLLSGFPLTAALKFSLYLRALGKVDPSILSPDESLLYDTYTLPSGFTLIERGPDNNKKFREILIKFGLSLGEQELVLKERSIDPSKGIFGGFFGFSEEDELFASSIRRFYLESGIEELNERLREEYCNQDE